MRDIYWGMSECGNSFLHRFNIIEQYPECVVEVCEICGQKAYFKTINGKCNNFDYLDHHLRQALFKAHPQYYREWKYNFYD
jgi:hypothetical protein